MNLFERQFPVGLIWGAWMIAMFSGCQTLGQPGTMFHQSLNLMQAQSARAANVLRSRESRMQASHELVRTAIELKRKGRPEEAIKTYLAAIELWPSETENHLALAELYQEMGQPEVALQYLKQGLNYDRDSIPLHLGLADAYLQLGRPHEALQHTDSVLGLERESAYCWRLRADAYFALQQWEDALAAGYQALALEPENEAALERVCQIYFKQQRPMRSWSIVQKMSARYTDENRPAKLRLLEAQTLVQMDRNSDAIQTLKRWYTNGGDQDRDCCTMLAGCLDKEGQLLSCPPGARTLFDPQSIRLVGVDDSELGIGKRDSRLPGAFDGREIGGREFELENQDETTLKLQPYFEQERQRPKFRPLDMQRDSW